MALQEVAPVRRFAQEVQQALAPVAHTIQARGMNPAQVIASYARADQALSDPRTAAKAAADLIRTYGIRVEDLATALDAPQEPAPPQAIDPRAIAAQVRQELTQSFAQERQQAANQKARAQIEEFVADPAHEFFEDVWPDMAGLIDSAKARGVELPLKDAYQRAVWADPKLRDIMQKRSAAEAAKAATASTQQARNAASSVKSTPSTGATAPRTPKNYREMVADAYDELAGR